MKKILMTLVMLVALSTAVFANGPLLGISTVPVAGGFAALTVGYDFDEINIEAWKLDLTTPFGQTAVGLIWTPSIDTFGYRAGAEIVMNYIQIGGAPLNDGQWRYDSFNFIIGVSKTWGPVQLYGEFNLLPVGALSVIPVVGVNFLFGDLIPEAIVE